MREYRFRAWDKKEQKWLPINEDGEVVIFGNGSRGLVDSSGITTHPDYVGDEVLEIMMFTGLYDKNKTPIYEGDIVRIFEHEFSPMDFVVEYSEINYCWWLSSVAKSVQYGVSQQMFSFSNLHGFEHDSIVIGDKFSNPELLHKEMKS